MNIEKTFLFLFLTLALSNSLQETTCGGNCLSNECRSCPCGLIPKYVDIANYCSKSSLWDVNCCKCMVSSFSKGNTNFMDQDVIGNFYLGVLFITPFFQCGFKTLKDYCNPDLNFECAEMIYK